ncbi:hypothetical protein R6V09_06645 [Streptomyces sp. W16]|uniref:hypothetical protein n=1 Tax=Streptomyces sp. W16 TaxID=3076631 RepID=UPI00295B463B|nr:hypothetical protein [Streptomyces sp. W16]MDV9169814.1 hypothetical protein [Streptomyces sp. W16]
MQNVDFAPGLGSRWLKKNEPDGDHVNGLGFYERYQEIGRTAKRKGPVTPEVDLWEWKQFADGCVARYDDNLAEYQGDLWIRRNIQLALDDEELRGMEGFAAFSEAVGRVDEVFKSLLRWICPAEIHPDSHGGI